MRSRPRWTRTAGIALRWHGEELDRLLDEAHARLVDEVVRRSTVLGWVVAVEVSFSRYGERGSIDVLRGTRFGEPWS